jgi:hypothetical protein
MHWQWENFGICIACGGAASTTAASLEEQSGIPNLAMLFKFPSPSTAVELLLNF